MEMYREKAAKQAKTAMEHFKDDFVYKIEARSGKLISAGTN